MVSPFSKTGLEDVECDENRKIPVERVSFMSGLLLPFATLVKKNLPIWEPEGF
jgi:hypothetical protein